MQDMVFSLAALLIAAFAFGLGAARLFKKKKPLYFQLLVCAAGCFALQMLSYTVNLWCGVTEEVGIGMLGIFGCNFFLLSANYGTLDRVVDDGKGARSARRLAVLAPAVMAVLAALVFLAWHGKNRLCAWMWLAMLLPAVAAAYFNLKHLLLPMDPFELLRATRPCNLAALAFYVLTALYGFASAAAGAVIIQVLTVLVSLSMLVLVLCAIKGAKQWGI